MNGLQQVGDSSWPECWLFYIRSDIASQGEKKVTETRHECGARTTYRKEMLTYTCACGSTFSRVPGFKIEEARAWVVEHAPHVAEVGHGG